MFKVKLGNAKEISADTIFEYFAEDFDESSDFYGLLNKKLRQEVSHLSDEDSPAEYIRTNYPNEYLKYLHKWISELFVEQIYSYVEIENNGEIEYHYFEQI